MPSRCCSSRELDAHLLAQLGVEVGQRLVEQQHLRLAHQRARKRHALLLAAGELRRRAVLVARHAAPVSSALQHLLASSRRAEYLRSRATSQREGDVLEHRHVRPDRIGLEHHADVAVCAAARRCRLPVSHTARRRSTILPASGRSRPAMQRSVVVLPQPDGPSSVKNWPRSTCGCRLRGPRAHRACPSCG